MDDLKLLFTQFGSEFVYYPNLNAILAWIFHFFLMRENIDPSKTRMVQGPIIYRLLITPKKKNIFEDLTIPFNSSGDILAEYSSFFA